MFKDTRNIPGISLMFSSTMTLKTNKHDNYLQTIIKKLIEDDCAVSELLVAKRPKDRHDKSNRKFCKPSEKGKKHTSQQRHTNTKYLPENLQVL